MPGLRSLRNRLAVIFALIIVGAIGTIYLSVTPRLEASLTAQTLDQVETSSRQYTPDVGVALREPEEPPMLADGKTRDEARIKVGRVQEVRRLAESIGTEIIVTFPPERVVAAMAPMESSPPTQPREQGEKSERQSLLKRPLFRLGT